MARRATQTNDHELIFERRRLERERAQVAAEVAKTSQDFPLLPTSAVDASPILPEDSGDALTAAQRLAIATIVSGRTFAAAAQAAGVDRRTIYNWRQQPAFARTLDELTREALETTAVRVRNLMLRATRVLSDAMVGPDAFNGAIRVANSGRLWAALNKAEVKLDEAATSKG